MTVEDKTRRRLAPFLAEGQIKDVVFAHAQPEETNSVLTVMASKGQASSGPNAARSADLQAALVKAVADLGTEVRVILR